MELSDKKAALISSSLASFIVPFMGSAINIALPNIGKHFSIDAVLLNWIATSYLLTLAIFLIPIGRIADIAGRKKIFSTGIIIFCIASFFCGISWSAKSIIFFRVIQAIGSSMTFATSVAILTLIYSPKERGRVIGINVASVYTGLSMGPFLGGIITYYLGWRGIFFAVVPPSIFVAYLIYAKLKVEWVDAAGEKFDLSGSIIYGLSLSVLMYGFSITPSFNGWIFILTGFFGLFIFIVYEIKIKTPVLDVELFKNNPTFIFSNLAAMINYASTYAVAFLLSLYLQYIKSLTPKEAGLILLSQPVIMALFSPYAGKLSDKIEPRIVASMGMALTSVGLFILIFLNKNTQISIIVINLILLGFGFALFSSPNTNAILSSVEKKFYGVASAMVGTMRSIGQMMSMGIAMIIFAAYIGRVQITPEYHGIFIRTCAISFRIFMILCLIGIFFSLIRGKIRK